MSKQVGIQHFCSNTVSHWSWVCTQQTQNMKTWSSSSCPLLSVILSYVGTSLVGLFGNTDQGMIPVIIKMSLKTLEQCKQKGDRCQEKCSRLTFLLALPWCGWICQGRTAGISFLLTVCVLRWQPEDLVMDSEQGHSRCRTKGRCGPCCEELRSMLMYVESAFFVFYTPQLICPFLNLPFKWDNEWYVVLLPNPASEFDSYAQILMDFFTALKAYVWFKKNNLLYLHLKAINIWWIVLWWVFFFKLLLWHNLF